MPRVGRGHFAGYTPQNRVKHAILTKYFAAYLTALRNVADAFHYIDGFAGPGTYAEGEPGSPLQAIQLLADQPRPASASFVENDPALFNRLERAVGQAPGVATLFDLPVIECGEFSEWIDPILRRSIYKKFSRVATFAFVDPCGVNGLRMADLSKILGAQFGECLVFWNYDGLNRWLGGVAAYRHPRAKLDDFYGSSDMAADALACAQSGISGVAKERYLRDGYLHAVKERSGAQFLLPFRFQANDSQRTSHYLIHLCHRSLGFKIMKDVMRKAAPSVGDFGSFEFIPKDELGQQTEMFRPNADHAREEVLGALRDGVRPVGFFTKNWPSRPDDFLVGEQYKEILLNLETDELVEVLDGRTPLPKPAEKRIRNGKVTLGEKCIIRLRQS